MPPFKKMPVSRVQKPIKILIYYLFCDIKDLYIIFAENDISKQKRGKKYA